MTVPAQVAMADDAIDKFLSEHQTAILSLAYASQPYSIPVTYRFDPDSRHFYFRLVYSGHGEKQRFQSQLGEARLALYEESAQSYRSVIAVGSPKEIREDDLTTDHVTQFGETSRPLFELWSEPRRNLDIRLYELKPDRITGRRIDLPDTSE